MADRLCALHIQTGGIVTELLPDEHEKAIALQLNAKLPALRSAASLGCVWILAASPFQPVQSLRSLQLQQVTDASRHDFSMEEYLTSGGWWSLIPLTIKMRKRSLVWREACGMPKRPYLCSRWDLGALPMRCGDWWWAQVTPPSRTHS